VIRTPEPRTVVTLLILAGGAALSSFLLFINRDEEPERKPPELQLAYYLESAVLTGTAPDGTVLYTIRTRRAQQVSDSNSIELVDINMDYGAPRGLPWKVSAERGRIPHDARVIQLEGNVVAVSGENHPNQTVINTERLDIEPDTMRASTKNRVTLVFDNRRLNATGMVADFETNNLKLLSNVNGKFTP
jgi:LPS export ABC transporter protein LptC